VNRGVHVTTWEAMCTEHVLGSLISFSKAGRSYTRIQRVSGTVTRAWALAVLAAHALKLSHIMLHPGYTPKYGTAGEIRTGYRNNTVTSIKQHKV
jgi:hypothetical protein